MSHPKQPRRTFASIAAIVALLISAVGLATGASPAQAVNAKDFKPGNIVSDANFYNGQAMNAAEVQDFLNRKLASCKIGKAPYLPGSLSPSGSGNTIAKNCLKDFKMTTQTRAADAYCKSYIGQPNESAAQIIAKVGQACDISQKVLLIMLEKEQSLVTDDWPVTRQYNYAMGMDCPDSGPGNSANCDASGAGFFHQMIRGARQLQVYKANPSWFNYKPGRTNTIQWHPNKGCGTSQVYIENAATAALYIYTPYRPNQAALNAGWGTGDGCSSYGNRNFFLFYTSWFGSPTGSSSGDSGGGANEGGGSGPTLPAISGDIRRVYDRNPAMYGAPLETQVSVSTNGGGVVQRFETGLITSSTALNKTVGIVNGSFSAAYLAAGGAGGSWGFIASEKVTEPRSGASLQFQHGTAAWTGPLGVRYMPAIIAAAWRQAGGAGGTLGFPVADAVLTSSDAGSQRFEGGTLTVSSAGASVLGEADLASWQKLGDAKTVGKPLEGLQPLNGGATMRTEKGTGFFLNGATPLFVANGQFINAYSAAGGPAGAWGWPTVAKTPAANGSSTITFQNGTASHTHATGVVFLPKAAYDYWQANGGLTGNLGHPLETKMVGDGSYVKYANTTVFFGPNQTIKIDPGQFINAYLAAGGPTGAWGWPTVAKTPAANGSSTITFQNGTATHTPATGVTYLSKLAYDYSQTANGLTRDLGEPLEETVLNDGSYVRYATTTVFFGPNQTIKIDPGQFIIAYLAAGGPTGAWGWPTVAKTPAANGSSTITFQNGTATHTPATGVTFE